MEFDKEIINMYKKGHSIKFIAEDFYRHINKGRRIKYYHDFSCFAKPLMTRQECRLHVIQLIYNYNKKILKEGG